MPETSRYLIAKLHFIISRSCRTCMPSRSISVLYRFHSTGLVHVDIRRLSSRRWAVEVVGVVEGCYIKLESTHEVRRDDVFSRRKGMRGRWEWLGLVLSAERARMRGSVLQVVAGSFKRGSVQVVASLEIHVAHYNLARIIKELVS